MAVERRPATGDDARLLATAMRESDRLEIERMGFRPLQAVERSIRISDWADAFLVDGELAAIAGVQTIDALAGEGVPWLVGTDILDRYPVGLMRRVGAVLHEMMAGRRYLVNVVDAKNARTIRWLEHIGFHVKRDPPVMFGDNPFYLFEARA